jgi:hypothetical protein
MRVIVIQHVYSDIWSACAWTRPGCHFLNPACRITQMYERSIPEFIVIWLLYRCVSLAREINGTHERWRRLVPGLYNALKTKYFLFIVMVFHKIAEDYNTGSSTFLLCICNYDVVVMNKCDIIFYCILYLFDNVAQILFHITFGSREYLTK